MRVLVLGIGNVMFGDEGVGAFCKDDGAKLQIWP